MNATSLDRDAAGTLTKAGWTWALFVVGLLGAGALVLLIVDGQKVVGGVVYALAAFWSLVVVPVMLVVKSHVIRAGWESRPADPDTYFRGLLIVWGTIAAGAVLALIGCLWNNAMLPGGLLAGVMLTLLVALRPSSAALGGGMTPA